MTEAPRGLLAHLGEMFEEMQISGCTYEQAKQKREERERDEEEAFSNIVRLDDFRKKEVH
jgi:hypothetical protein